MEKQRVYFSKIIQRAVTDEKDMRNKNRGLEFTELSSFPIQFFLTQKKGTDYSIKIINAFLHSKHNGRINLQKLGF